MHWTFIVNPCVWLNLYLWNILLLASPDPKAICNLTASPTMLLPAYVGALPTCLHSVLSALSHCIWDLWWKYLHYNNPHRPVVPINVFGKCLSLDVFGLQLIKSSWWSILFRETWIHGPGHSHIQIWLSHKILLSLKWELCIWGQLSFPWDI